MKLDTPREIIFAFLVDNDRLAPDQVAAFEHHLAAHGLSSWLQVTAVERAAYLNRRGPDFAGVNEQGAATVRRPVHHGIPSF